MIFLWAIRFFLFPMYESPKFLCSIGRDADAVAVIHAVARRNGVRSTLTLEDLEQAAKPYLPKHADDKTADVDGETPGSTAETRFSTWALVRHSFDDLDGEHIRALFGTPHLAWSTSLIIYCYAALGLAYPLFK